MSRKAMEQLAKFPLMEALLGRRSRRFAVGASIDSGPLEFHSQKPPQPLNEMERTLIISSMAGNTGWNHLIPFNQKYAPALPNYAGSAGGRTFPSAAGFHTCELFFTDDSGVYFLNNRNAAASPNKTMANEMDIDSWLEHTRGQIRQLSDTRLKMPNEEPHVESHNLWIANCPGSLFAIPVVDLAQHMILMLCYLAQNGYCIFNDFLQQQVPGIDKFKNIVDTEHPYPLSYIEQITLGEGTVEVSTSCYAGALMLQAMGLGGWMYDGVDRHSIFGVSGDPRNKGLGFSSVTRSDWVFPNPVGIPGVFEAFCPPYFPNMRTAVRAVVERKFGPKGPFHAETPGPWKESPAVRGSAKIHSEEFVECVGLQAQYIYDTYGKFPGTLPSTYCLMYLQAHHLDLEFYDKYYRPGSYLSTHENHQKDWHWH